MLPLVLYNKLSQLISKHCNISKFFCQLGQKNNYLMSSSFFSSFIANITKYYSIQSSIA
uniref:Uncharacterized protein n=1 Tax=Physcomitrium patens TaxID=3218 RepID=A0A2K1KPN3_PHYPA|nr:hypothetical protein PHYPA_006603 [Physcomitrium patens]